MKKRRGRPPLGSEGAKGEVLEVRLGEAEKQAFKDAADLAGVALSMWVRERLHVVAKRELEKAGRSASFLGPSEGKKS